MGVLAIFGTSVLIPGVIVSAAENTSQEVQSSESVPSITINVNGANQTIPDVEIENSTAGLVGTPIYQDEQGNQFTKDRIVSESTTPFISSRSMSARPIYIGIKWTYTNREDGRRLRDLFRKVAFFDKTLGAIAGLLGLAGIVTERLSTVLRGLGAGAGTEIGERFEKGADLVNEHPDSGRIYMYSDHVTYRKYH